MYISCIPLLLSHLLLVERLNMGHIRSVEVEAGHM